MSGPRRDENEPREQDPDADLEEMKLHRSPGSYRRSKRPDDSDIPAIPEYHLYLLRNLVRGPDTSTDHEVDEEKLHKDDYGIFDDK